MAVTTIVCGPAMAQVGMRHLKEMFDAASSLPPNGEKSIKRAYGYLLLVTMMYATIGAPPLLASLVCHRLVKTTRSLSRKAAEVAWNMLRFPETTIDTVAVRHPRVNAIPREGQCWIRADAAG
ncbi:hypothetical protein ACFL6X_03615 [Candidatus Latescibacterota bacterium]